MARTRTLDSITVLPVDDLILGDDVRLDEDTEDLDELAASIAALGVLQPLLVRAAGEQWEVVAGRRRLAGARIAGLAEVPCIVRALDDAAAFDATLAENLHRRNLSPIEEGLAYARLRDDGGLTQQQIARRVGRSQTHVSMLLRVLELPANLRDRVHGRQLSYRTALDLWGRKRYRDDGANAGGKSTKGKLTGSDSELVSHWRRRHDRVVAGLHSILRARPCGDDQWTRACQRLLELDREPLQEAS